MRRFPYAVLFAFAITAGLGVHFLNAAEKQPQAGAETVSVEKLLERIEKLERRVAELEQGQQRQMVSILEQKSRSLQERPVPPNWIPKEFNGQTIYYVPLGRNRMKGDENSK